MHLGLIFRVQNKSLLKFQTKFSDKSFLQKLYPTNLYFFWNFSKYLFVKLIRRRYNLRGELLSLIFPKKSHVKFGKDF